MAAYRSNPWGERRADLRAAINTVSLKLALSMEPVEKTEYVKMVQALMSYMPCDREQEGIEINEAALNNLPKRG